MRNPKRIDKLVKLITAIWKDNPDMRLCQLIGNCFDPGDLYNIEDDLLEVMLRRVYAKRKPKCD